MWIIIVIIVVLVLVPLTMRVSGSDSTYCVMYYNMTREFTGTRDACETWIENKIKSEKEKLTRDMEKMCMEHNIPKQNISEEIRQMETLLRQNYKITRLN